MAPDSDHSMPLRVVRQLRRIRAFYSAAAFGWAVLAAWEGWEHPGSRPMWLSLLFVAIFTGLLVTTSLWLQGHGRAGEGDVRRVRPARHTGCAPWLRAVPARRAAER